MLAYWPHSVENRAALRTAIAALAAVLISFAFHLQTPYWSGMTVVIVANLYTGSIIDKAMMRIVGTIAGAFLGFYIAGLVANSILLYLLFCFLVVTVSVYYYNFSVYGYAYLLGALSAFIIISQLAINPQNAFFVAIWRPVEIGIGVVISAISAYCVFPNHLKDNIVVQVQDIFADLSNEFNQLFSGLSQDTVDLSAVAVSNLKVKKDVRKAVELINVMRRELGITRQHIDELRAFLDSFYDLTRQLQYLLISAPKPHDLMVLHALPLEGVNAAIQLDLAQIQKSFVEHSSVPLQLHTGAAITVLQNQFNGQKNSASPRSDFIYSFIHILLQVNQRFIIMQSLLMQTPISIMPKYTLVSREERLRTDLDLIKHSIKAGLSVLLALGFWLVSSWPGGLNGIISSVMISIRKNLYEMKHISIHRILGCFLGGGLALLALNLVAMNLFDLILVLFLGIWGFSYYMFLFPKYAYIGLQANIALIITLAQEGGPPVVLDPPLQRLAGIFIGIIASFIVANIIWRSDALTVLTRYTTKLYKYMVYNLRQVLLVPGNQKSLYDLVTLFWVSRGLIESLQDEQLTPKKLEQVGALTHRFETLVIIQATISHILVTIDTDLAHHTSAVLNCDLKTYEREIVALYEQQDRIEGRVLSQKLQDIIAGVDNNPGYAQLEDPELRNFLAYLNALNQLVMRSQVFI